MNLDEFNQQPADLVRPPLRACCDVPAWADRVLAGRPYADVDALVGAADAASRDLSPADVDRALAAHPRIGERAQGGSTEATWSRGEQAAVVQAADSQSALREGNLAYEARFGRVFLICATGLSAEQILSALRRRLTQEDATEAAEVADELRKIAALRIRKLVA